MSEVAPTNVALISPRSAAGIAAFRNHDAARAALQNLFGVTPPTGAGFIQAGPVTLSCLSPNRYFAVGPRDSGLPSLLARALDGIAAVTDQSDMWASFALSGDDVQETLARIVPIDLTPSRFPVGALALTRAGHCDVRLWRVAYRRYELSVDRSCADDLRYALGMGVCWVAKGNPS
jgi:sarcosine oxidase subunit gamma